MNKMKITNVDNVLLIFLLLMRPSNSIKLSISKKEFDDFYSQLLNDDAAGDQKYFEKAKLRLEMAMFGHEIEETFKNINQMQLAECQKQIFEQKRRDFDELMGSIMEISYRDKCELWKFWNDLEYTIEKNQLKTVRMDNFYAIIRYQNPNGPFEVNCERVGRELSDKNGIIDGELEEKLKAFSADTKSAHFGAILFLLGARRDGEEAGSICGILREGSGIWEFSKYFGTKQLENESNFAYQLRMLRIINEPKSLERILAIKAKIKQITFSFLEVIEFKEPILMGLDLIDEATLSEEYFRIVSDESISENDLKMGEAELKISLRIYFGRIWNIFSKVSQLKRQNIRQMKGQNKEKLDKIFGQIEQIWDIEMAGFVVTVYSIDKPITLAKAFKFWRKLVDLYNKMPILKKIDRIEKKEKCQLEGKNNGTIMQIARDELFEEHLKNMGLLYQKQNNFSDLLKNASDSDRRMFVFRIRDFFAPKAREQNQLEVFKNRYTAFVALIKSHSELREMLRFEWANDDVVRLQIKNYIKFLDNDSQEKLWEWAKFHLDVLAHYQWLKKHMKNLAKAKQELINNNLVVMVEIWVDCENEFADGIYSESAANGFLHIQSLRDLKKQMFPGFDGLAINQMHEECVKTLFSHNQFIQALKNIYVNGKRANEMFGAKAEIVKMLVNGSSKSVPQITQEMPSNFAEVDKKGTDEEGIEAEETMLRFKHFLMSADGPVSDNDKRLLTIETFYFRHKKFIKELLDFLRGLKSKEKPKLTKIIIQIEVEAARADFSGPSGDPKQKEAQICYMNSFLSRMMGNGTLGEESESWRKYLKTRGSIEMKQEEGEGDDELNRGVPSSAESDQKWEKPNCEDSVLSSRVLNKLAKSPILEENFVKVLSALFKKFPQFLQFVGQSLKAIPTFETLEDNEKAAHYKNLLENGKFRDEKGTFSLRLLWERANLLRKEFGQKFHKEIFEANAHLVAVLRVVRVFAAGEFAHLRMICLMAKFVYFLEEMSEKRPDKEWHFLNSCFKMETPELWHLQQKHTANEHFKFFATFLANCPRTNEIAAILRENEPSLLNLRNILGKENMKKLWEIPQIRDKLLDRNFFNDKLRLLALYRQVIGGQSKCARMGARIGADISVWANWNFVRMSGDGNSSANGHLFGRVSLMPPGEETLLDDFWLFFRLSFSKCRNWAAQIGGTNGEEGEKQLAKLSVELNSLIPAIDQFIADGRKNKKLASDVSKYLNLWREREKAATAQIAFRSIESAPNECAGPIESVQKLHFANFSAFLNEQNAGPIKEAFDLLIAALTEKKKAQKNLLELLKIEEMKTFLNEIGVNFDGQNSKEKSKKAKNQNQKVSQNLGETIKVNSEKIGGEILEENISKLSEENGEKSAQNLNNKNSAKNKKKKSKNKKVGDRKNCEKVEEFELENENLANNFCVERSEERKKNELLAEWHKINSAKDYYGDATISGKYFEFVLDPSDAKRFLLDIGAIVHETGQRFKAMDEMKKFGLFDHFLGEKLKNEWNELLEGNQWKNEENLAEFLEKLGKILAKIVTQMEGTAISEKDMKMAELKVPIHQRSLALSLIGDQKFENVWTNLGENERKEILFRLLGPIRVGPTRFAHLTMAWRRMREQIEIDQMLYDKLLHPSSQIAFLLPTFPLYSQQLNFAQNKMAESKLTERFENYLTESFHANSVQKSDRETFEAEIKGALMEIKQMVDEWSRGRARLLISGSFLLGAHTIHSDIDLICAVPGKAIKGRDFFGDQPSICKSNRCFCSPTDAEDGGGAGANLSLFCRFCRHKKMTKSVAISVGRVPMIQIKFAQIPFDISFVSFLGLEILPPQIGNKFIALAMQKLDINNGEHKKTLRILSSYQSTVHIANLVMDGPTTGSGSWGEQLLTHNAKNSETEPPKNKNFTKNAKNFRLMLLALKLWAKSDLFGFNFYVLMK
ncbi:hypothetical protein GPALN_003481 [Globodera pallida]|nr:hypothetical protein GPALN_003481 [Globodera pallida]